MSQTPQEHQQDILSKLSGLSDYVNKLSTILDEIDINRPQDELPRIENHILMIQGQKEFVKMSITAMKDKYGNGR